MPLVDSVIVALCSGALVGVALAVTFYLIRTGTDHEPLEDSYLRCDGGWHEAYLDVLAIYWVFVGLLIYIIGRLWILNEPLVTVGMFLLAGVIAAFLRLIWREVSIHWKVALILGFILGLSLWYVHRAFVSNGYRWIGVSFGLFLLAFLVWILDVKKLFWPRRWGHGIWHIFTGIAIPILSYVASR